MLGIIRKSHFLQDMYLCVSALIHPAMKHNIEKIGCIKSALWYSAAEGVKGGYFEFGVFEGTSLKAAATINRSIRSTSIKEFYNFRADRKLYGFDSFEGGFKHESESEDHNIFTEGNFTSSYKVCMNRLRKFREVKLIKGYFEDTVQDRHPHEVPVSEKCAVALIDCDLFSPSLVALNFLLPMLQLGSVLILDDAYAYKGNPELGVYGAFMKFLQANPTVKVRDYRNFGVSGKSYIVYEL